MIPTPEPRIDPTGETIEIHWRGAILPISGRMAWLYLKGALHGDELREDLNRMCRGRLEADYGDEDVSFHLHKSYPKR